MKALRILIVDDEALIRKILKALLALDGHAVETASDGREALEKIRATAFDLVITDHSMPGMDGMRLAAAIRGESPRTPIILMSGYGDVGVPEGGSPAPVDVVLPKPATAAALREAVARAGERRIPALIADGSHASMESVAKELQAYALARGVIYGPVRSRRLGASLGVNLLPFGVKVCSFNCSYCQCGWTYDTVDHATLAKLVWPTPAEIGGELERALADLRARGERLDSITLSGNGEPTLHPRFADAVRAVVAARDRAWPGVRTDVLTNGAHLGTPGVVEGLNLLDERMVKIDAGTEAMFMDMNTPVTPVSLQDVTGRVRELRDFIAQSMFTQGRIDNTGDENVGRWVDLLCDLRPKLVQVYGISRAPADARLRPVPHERLAWIADQARARGLSVQIA